MLSFVGWINLALREVLTKPLFLTSKTMGFLSPVCCPRLCSHALIILNEYKSFSPFLIQAFWISSTFNWIFSPTKRSLNSPSIVPSNDSSKWISNVIKISLENWAFFNIFLKLDSLTWDKKTSKSGVYETVSSSSTVIKYELFIASLFNILSQPVCLIMRLLSIPTRVRGGLLIVILSPSLSNSKYCLLGVKKFPAT